MSLVKNDLISGLKDTFKKMKDAGEDASDSDFSSGIADACKAFIEAGDITIVATGTVSSGVFTGGGSGHISLESSKMSTVIDTATASMKDMTSGGDDVLASALFSGLNAMISAGTVEIDVSGATVSPSGATVPPSSGKTKGTGLTCIDGASPQDFVSKTKKIFKDMKDRTTESGFNGDNFLAEQLADVINTYISTGTVTTSGQGALSGVTGTGKIA